MHRRRGCADLRRGGADRGGEDGTPKGPTLASLRKEFGDEVVLELGGLEPWLSGDRDKSVTVESAARSGAQPGCVRAGRAAARRREPYGRAPFARTRPAESNS